MMAALLSVLSIQSYVRMALAQKPLDGFLDNALSLTNNYVCDAGPLTVLPITSKFQLKQHLDLLPCILATGVPPIAMADGMEFVGEALKVGESEYWRLLTFSLWTGKSITQASCDDGARTKLMAQNNMAGRRDYLFAEPYIGSIDLKLAPGESPLSYGVGNDEYMIVDYRALNCETTAKDVAINKRDFHNDDLRVASSYPFNTIVDAMRIVGEDQDGNKLILGRTLVEDWITKEYFTLAYFSMLSKEIEYDQVSLAENSTIENGFETTLPGVRDSFARFLAWGRDLDDFDTVDIPTPGINTFLGTFNNMVPDALNPLTYAREAIDAWTALLETVYQ